VGQPLFGSRYCGEREDLVVSWGLDGNLCLWDSNSTGNVKQPLAVLKNDNEYPIYAVEVSKDCVAVGGGRDGGFVGVPLYLYGYDSSDSVRENGNKATNDGLIAQDTPSPRGTTKDRKEA